MSYLLIFIAGILFIEFLFPLFSKIIELWTTAIDSLISDYGEKISNTTIKIQQARVKAELGEDTTPKYQIGFTIPTEDEDDEGNEEDDDEI